MASLLPAELRHREGRWSATAHRISKVGEQALDSGGLAPELQTHKLHLNVGLY